MKLFVTVGLEKIQFNRLLEIVDQNVYSGIFPKETFIQAGYSSCKPKYCSYCRFLDYNDLEKMVTSSDVVLSHAGVGVVILCLKHGKIPILFPRRLFFKEHIDDHQFIFAKIMAKQGIVLSAFSSDGLQRIYLNYRNLANSAKKIKNLDRKKDLVFYLKEKLADF